MPSSLHGWLAAVLPADARRFRVSEPELGATLLEAGAELDSESPDVEIARPEDFTGDIDDVIVSLDAAQPEGGRRALRVTRRLLGTARVRVDAARWQRTLRGSGYRSAEIVTWDIEHLVYLPNVRGSLHRRHVAEHFPQRALVVGSRSPEPSATVLESVAEEAATAIGGPLRYGWPLARAGMLVVIGGSCVLRVAVGPGRRKLELQRVALEALAAGGPAPVVAERVPWALASGRAGLADWSADHRLSGSPAPPRLPDRLLADCVDFLVALHGVGAGRIAAAPVSADAEVVADVCTRDDWRETALALGRGLDELLADAPRGFGHGDFWRRNLLVEEGRLTGVVDWDGADARRLPLVDLLHLRLSARRERTREYLGAALVDELLPWAREGGDDVAHAYCERIGLPVRAELLEALAIAYWLDRVAFELRMFGDRTMRPLWMQENVHRVLEHLGRESALVLGAAKRRGPTRSLPFAGGDSD